MTPLAMVELAIALGQAAMSAFGAKPEYAGLVTSTQAGLAELDKARQEIITSAELESLRTQPQW